MKWEYIKDKGIRSSKKDIELFFNKEKKEIDDLLEKNSKVTNGRDSNEFCYSNIFNTTLDIRLNFENNLLKEIEILSGVVVIEDTNVAIDAKIRKPVNKLNLKGFKCFKHAYGYTFPSLKIDLGDRYKNGGEFREICWVYTADNIDHLLDEL